MTAELLLIAAINFCSVFTDPVQRQLCVFDLADCFVNEVSQYDYVKKNPKEYSYLLPIPPSDELIGYKNCFVFTKFSKIKSDAKRWKGLKE